MILQFDRVAFGLLAIVLFISSAQQQAKAHAPSKHRQIVLTGQEILTQVIGNTAYSVGKKHKWTEYYHPDGTIQGRTDGNAVESDDGPYQGKWTVSDSKMCFVYVNSGDVGCYTISIKDNEITYSNKGGGHSNTGTLLKGNPNNL